MQSRETPQETDARLSGKQMDNAGYYAKVSGITERNMPLGRNEL